MNGVLNTHLPSQDDARVCIYYINQGTPMEGVANVFNISSVGLSNSRNFALSLCQNGDVVILTDNDVGFNVETLSEVEKFFENNSDYSILTFKSLLADGTPFKKYNEYEFSHDFFSIMKVSSIEIAIRISPDIPMFDSSFGLGAKYPLGEENIFLSDALRKGLKAKYMPINFSVHFDNNHTGLAFDFNSSLQRFNVFIRVYGYFLGRFIFLLFVFKSFNKFRSGFLKSLFLPLKFKLF